MLFVMRVEKAIILVMVMSIIAPQAQGQCDDHSWMPYPDMVKNVPYTDFTSGISCTLPSSTPRDGMAAFDVGADKNIQLQFKWLRKDCTQIQTYDRTVTQSFNTGESRETSEGYSQSRTNSTTAGVAVQGAGVASQSAMGRTRNTGSSQGTSTSRQSGESQTVPAGYSVCTYQLTAAITNEGVEQPDFRLLEGREVRELVSRDLLDLLDDHLANLPPSSPEFHQIVGDYVTENRFNGLSRFINSLGCRHRGPGTFFGKNARDRNNYDGFEYTAYKLNKPYTLLVPHESCRSDHPPQVLIRKSYPPAKLQDGAIVFLGFPSPGNSDKVYFTARKTKDYSHRDQVKVLDSRDIHDERADNAEYRGVFQVKSVEGGHGIEFELLQPGNGHKHLGMGLGAHGGFFVWRDEGSTWSIKMSSRGRNGGANLFSQIPLSHNTGQSNDQWKVYHSYWDDSYPYVITNRPDSGLEKNGADVDIFPVWCNAGKWNIREPDHLTVVPVSAEFLRKWDYDLCDLSRVNCVGGSASLEEDLRELELDVNNLMSTSESDNHK